METDWLLTVMERGLSQCVYMYMVQTVLDTQVAVGWGRVLWISWVKSYLLILIRLAIGSASLVLHSLWEPRDWGISGDNQSDLMCTSACKYITYSKLNCNLHNIVAIRLGRSHPFFCSTFKCCNVSPIFNLKVPQCQLRNVAALYTLCLSPEIVLVQLLECSER